MLTGLTLLHLVFENKYRLPQFFSIDVFGLFANLLSFLEFIIVDCRIYASFICKMTLLHHVDQILFIKEICLILQSKLQFKILCLHLICYYLLCLLLYLDNLLELLLLLFLQILYAIMHLKDLGIPQLLVHENVLAGHCSIPLT